MINFNFLFIYFFFAEEGYLLKALFVRESQVLEVYILSLFSNSKLINPNAFALNNDDKLFW